MTTSLAVVTTTTKLTPSSTISTSIRRNCITNSCLFICGCFCRWRDRNRWGLIVKERESESVSERATGREREKNSRQKRCQPSEKQKDRVEKKRRKQIHHTTISIIFYLPALQMSRIPMLLMLAILRPVILSH